MHSLWLISQIYVICEIWVIGFMSKAILVMTIAKTIAKRLWRECTWENFLRCLNPITIARSLWDIIWEVIVFLLMLVELGIWICIEDLKGPREPPAALPWERGRW